MFFFSNSLLPNPSHVVRDRDDERALMRPPSTALVSLRESRAPPYGKRKGWTPRSAEVRDKIPEIEF